MTARAARGIHADEMRATPGSAAGPEPVRAPTTARPIVKWAGGKTRLLPELLARVPTTMKTYAEPFAGGAALFFALASERASAARDARTFKRARLFDRNEDLVACYRAVRDDVERLIDALGGYRYDQEQFYAVREIDPSGLSDVERGARLIFLNRTCYNGLWRVNSRGQFNVPFGRYKKPRILDAEGLRAASALLAGVEIEVGDFMKATRGLGAGDFVYFDPPYVPVSATADFTAYASGGFSEEDQRRLVAEVHALKERGAMVVLSNADTEATRALYSEFCVHVVRAPRAINSDPKKRGDASELLVTSWGEVGVH